MQKIEHPKKPQMLEWISEESWKSLSLKEKDYILMLYQRKWTKEKIMRNLHIESRIGFRKLRINVQKKLLDDVNKVNIAFKNNGNI